MNDTSSTEVETAVRGELRDLKMDSKKINKIMGALNISAKVSSSSQSRGSTSKHSSGWSRLGNRDESTRASLQSERTTRQRDNELIRWPPLHPRQYHSMKITCFPEETINPDEKSDQFPQELKPASKTEIQRILCRTQMKLDKHCEKIERLSSEYEELTHFTVNTESYTKDAQIAKAESVKNVTVSSSSGVHTWYGYGASASANCRFDETIQQPRTEPIPMNYDAHEVEKLNSRYNTELDKAEAAADDGRPQEAAEHYRNAANTKEAIAHERGTTVPDKVQKLRSIADRAAKGDAIVRNNRNDGSSGSAHGTAETDLSNPGRTAATGGEGDSSEFREVIESFIVDTDVGWNDIGGLTDTKERLRSGVGAWCWSVK